MLVVTLTLCAFALKIAAHDQYTSHESDARRRLPGARRKCKRLLREAVDDFQSHIVAWCNLIATRDDLVRCLSERYGEAYQFTMSARGFHEHAGSRPPAFAYGDRSGSLRDRVRAELAGVISPEPSFFALRVVEEAIQRFPADPLDKELQAMREEWISQLSAVRRTPDVSSANSRALCRRRARSAAVAHAEQEAGDPGAPYQQVVGGDGEQRARPPRSADT